jgi:hypothetical protein
MTAAPDNVVVFPSPVRAYVERARAAQIRHGQAVTDEELQAERDALTEEQRRELDALPTPDAEPLDPEAFAALVRELAEEADVFIRAVALVAIRVRA